MIPRPPRIARVRPRHVVVAFARASAGEDLPAPTRSPGRGSITRRRSRTTAARRATNDDAQEVSIVSLPDNARGFYEAKGHLCFITKEIINAPSPVRVRTRGGGEVQFEVMYQRGGKGKAEPVK